MKALSTPIVILIIILLFKDEITVILKRIGQFDSIKYKDLSIKIDENGIAIKELPIEKDLRITSEKELARMENNFEKVKNKFFDWNKNDWNAKLNSISFKKDIFSDILREIKLDELTTYDYDGNKVDIKITSNLGNDTEFKLANYKSLQKNIYVEGLTPITYLILLSIDDEDVFSDYINPKVMDKTKAIDIFCRKYDLGVAWGIEISQLESLIEDYVSIVQDQMSEGKNNTLFKLFKNMATLMQKLERTLLDDGKQQLSEEKEITETK